MSLFFLALSAVLSNLVPVVLKYIVDDVSTGNYSRIFGFLALILILKASNVFIYPLGIHISDLYIFDAINSIRLKVFEHLHKLDFAFHVNKSSGSLISLFKRGEGAIFTFHIHINHFNTQALFNLIFILIVFGGLYPKMILVTLVVVFLNSILMYFTIRNNIKFRGYMNKQEDKISGLTVDNMIAFDTVKYFTNEDYEFKKLKKELGTWKDIAMGYVKTFRVIDIGNGGIIELGMVLVIIVAAFDLVAGNVTIGDFILATSFATLFFPQLLHMVFNFREVAKTFVDLDRYLSILDEPILIKDEPKKDAQKLWKSFDEKKKYDIEFKNVNFGYNKKVQVLKDIDLYIKPGESVALVGKSGAGKTTITKLLLRFYDPSAGDISIGGINIKDLGKQEFRKRIGVVPQDPLLFNETLGYNLAYGREKFTQQELDKAIEKASLKQFVEELPDGYKTMVGERGVKLSGGQKQRLAIARVILEDAPIIIFDEATSALDSESERLIQEAFWKAAKSKTAIIIAHRLSTIKRADRIIVMDDGQIVEQGTHEELANASSGIYKHLWELQSKGEIS